jgi:hypothetical protein
MPSSGWRYWEYVAVYGCLRALMTADVAVTVAVRDTSGPSASAAGSPACANTCPRASPVLDALASTSTGMILGARPRAVISRLQR